MIPHTNEPESAIARLMAFDHEHLEQLFRAVMASFRGGDLDTVRARWLELDRALGRHLSLEEELLLPGFERAFPSSAARLRHEHREIRGALLALGVDLDLHELCPASATQFIDALRAHAAYEDAVLYPWAEQNLPAPERQSLFARLRQLRTGRLTSSHEPSEQRS